MVAGVAAEPVETVPEIVTAGGLIVAGAAAAPPCALPETVIVPAIVAGVTVEPVWTVPEMTTALGAIVDGVAVVPAEPVPLIATAGGVMVVTPTRTSVTPTPGMPAPGTSRPGRADVAIAIGLPVLQVDGGGGLVPARAVVHEGDRVPLRRGRRRRPVELVDGVPGDDPATRAVLNEDEGE
jgi:hypothetical protein